MDYPGGLTSHNLVFSFILCSVMVIEWLGLPLGAKFPFVPKIQAGQKCQFCDQYYLSMVLVMPKVQVGQAKEVLLWSIQQ